jgi:hypothetical protein
VDVVCGSGVEVGDGWLAEGVWDGDFERGALDLAQIVAGSGVRITGRSVVFVSSSTTVDRLWWLQQRKCSYVSNSLPALLSVSGTSLLDTYGNYRRDLRSIIRGTENCTRQIPVSSGTLTAVYYHNLRLSDGQWEIVPRAAAGRPFRNFEDYRDYLFDVAARIGANCAERNRHAQVTPLVALSSGYDSSAAAVAARVAGCKHTVTLERARSHFAIADSGEEIAHHLGLSCTSYLNYAGAFRDEVWFWAALGGAEMGRKPATP